MITLLATMALAGEISGVVLDDEGEPVNLATVLAYDHRLHYAWVRTDADGVFELQDLPPNPYRLRVLTPMDLNLVEHWVGGHLTLCEAEVHDLREGDVSGVEVNLQAGGRISGQLLDAWGQPVTGAPVSGRSVVAGTTLQVRHSFTNPDGYFHIRGLAPEGGSSGTFRLQVNVAGIPTQFLPGEYAAADATSYTVSPGEALDLDSITLREGIRVSGTVHREPWPETSARVNVFSSPQVRSVEVDAEGAYSVSGLPPGEVLAWVSSEGFAQTYLPDADRPGERLPLHDEGLHAEGADLYPPHEAQLRGRIVGPGAVEYSGVDLANISVLAWNDDQSVALGGQTDESGVFTVGGLHQGTYTLYVYGRGHGFRHDFARDETGEPLTFEVPGPGGATDVHVIELPLAARIEGRVHDLYSEEPIFGAMVVAEGVTTGHVAHAQSQRDGTYAIEGLAADGYRLRAQLDPFCPGDPNWLTTWYPNVPDQALQSVATLGSGEVLVWDPALAPDHDHDGVDDHWDGSIEGDRNVLQGCDGCGGGKAGLLLGVLPWWWRRRVARPHRFDGR